MKLVLIGYGKMGKIIEELAPPRGHEIILKIDSSNPLYFTRDNMARADIAIEFTGPATAYDNVKKCLEMGIPVVSGSTGWTERLDEMKTICSQNNGAFIFSSNFSVGVNIFFEVNKTLAALMELHKEYEVTIEEIHHTQKKDSPSGTAITLAEQVLEQVSRKKRWVNEISENPAELEIISQRIDATPGTHRVKYVSAIDEIEIVHTAHNRKGFAAGALLAAEFLQNKKGFFTMKEVLGL